MGAGGNSDIVSIQLVSPASGDVPDNWEWVSNYDNVSIQLVSPASGDWIV